MLNGGPGQDTYVCGGGEEVVVDFSRYTEQIGHGCEAVIFDVEPVTEHVSPRPHGSP